MTRDADAAVISSSPGQRRSPLDGLRSLLTFRKSDGLALFLLAVFLIKRSVGIRYGLPLELDDETLYLSWGTNLLSDGFQVASWGPLYSLWYWLLSHVISDPLDLYFANWMVLTSSVILLFYGCLRVLRVRPSIALALTIYLASTHFLYLRTFVSYAALIILAGALLLAQLPAVRAHRLSVITAAFGMACFIRPELTFSFAVCLALLIYAKSTDRNAREYSDLLFGAAPFVVLCILLGNPLGGPRPIDALRAGYAVNVVRAHHIDVDPWNNIESLTAPAFGKAKSVPEAVIANPRAFSWHVAQNVRSLYRFGRILLFRFTASRLLRALLSVSMWLILAVGFATLVRTLSQEPNRGFRHAISSADTSFRGSVVLATVCLMPPALGSSLLALPMHHYFVSAWFFLLLLAGLGLERLRQRTRVQILPHRLAVFLPGVFALAIIPTGSNEFGMHRNDDEVRQGLQNLRTVQTMRSLHVTSPVRLLEPEPTRGVFTNWKVTRFGPADCRNTFYECISVNSINIIVFDEALRAYFLERGDTTVLGFPSTADALQFELHQVQGFPGVSIAVRREP